MTKRPDPGNPPQTLCVQYNGIEAFDGATPSRPYVRALTSPNNEGIIEINQGGPLGLVDPDGGEGGAMGDRFLLWTQIVLDEPAQLEGQIVDGEDPSIVLLTVIPSQAVAQSFFRGTHFRVPQGALLRLVTTPLVSGRLRYRPALEPDDCCDAAGGSGPQPVIAEFASINWQFPPLVAQTGSQDEFVDVLGAGVLAPGAQGFTSPVPNQFAYAGDGGDFFVRAQLGIQPQQADSVSMRLRIAVNGVAVPDSEMYLIRASVQGIDLATSAQVSLETGDVVSVQIHNQNGTLPLSASAFGAQIQRVSG